MTPNGEIHVDRALRLLDQPIAEHLMIPLNVVLLRVLPNGLASVPPAQRNDLSQTLRVCRSSKDFGPRTLFAKRRFLVPT